MGLWVFILIQGYTFSFLANVGLRLTLGFLTISLSRVSPSTTLVHSPSSGSIPNHEYSFIALFCTSVLFLMGHAYLKLFPGRLSILPVPPFLYCTRLRIIENREQRRNNREQRMREQGATHLCIIIDRKSLFRDTTCNP